MAAAFDSVDSLQPSKALSVSFSITNSEIKVSLSAYHHLMLCV